MDNSHLGRQGQIISSGNFENFDKFHTESADTDYCSRCKMKEADFYCESCDPYFYFCSTCDGYVHSMNIKRHHQRTIINKSPNFGKDKGKNYQNANFNSTNALNSINRSYSTHFKTNSDLNYSHTLSNQNLNNFKENYVNDIKKLFEREREDLATKNLALERELDRVKSNLNAKIVNLQSQLEETDKKKNLDLKIMEEEYNIEIKKIITDKDNEIKNLTHKNRELEKSNSELLSKVNEFQNEIFQLKNKFGNLLNSADLEIKQKDSELIELKSYYEKRLNSITENMSEDKNKTISNYERNIVKLNTGYKESKDKYIALLKQRDNDISELLQKMKLEENKNNTFIDSLKLEIAKLKEENSLLNQANNELKYEIKTNLQAIEKSKKEAKFYMKESKKLEEEYKNTVKESEDAKVKLQKLHTITHGKFAKKK